MVAPSASHQRAQGTASPLLVPAPKAASCQAPSHSRLLCCFSFKPPCGFAASKIKGHVTHLAASCLGIVVVQPQDFDEETKRKKEFTVSVCFFVLCRVCALSVMSSGHVTIPRVVYSSVLCVLVLSLRATVLDHPPPSHSLPFEEDPPA